MISLRMGNCDLDIIPVIKGLVSEKDKVPVMLRACRIPTAAAEDWMMAVNTIPTRIPSTGLENFVSRLMNAGSSFRGMTALLMAVMPNIRIANPRRIAPT